MELSDKTQWEWAKVIKPHLNVKPDSFLINF